MSIPSLTPELAAYFAGIFDGEGYVNVYINKKNGVATLFVGVGSTFLELPAMLQSNFGGYLTKVRLSNPLARKYSREWKATNDVAAEALKVMYPYLVIKKRQAALAFKLRNVVSQDLRSKDAHRRQLLLQLADEIKDLNGRRQARGVETVKSTSIFGEEPVHCPA